MKSLQTKLKLLKFLFLLQIFLFFGMVNSACSVMKTLNDNPVITTIVVKNFVAQKVIKPADDPKDKAGKVLAFADRLSGAASGTISFNALDEIIRKAAKYDDAEIADRMLIDDGILVVKELIKGQFKDKPIPTDYTFDLSAVIQGIKMAASPYLI